MMKKILLLLLLTPTLTFGQLKAFLTKKEPNLQAWTKGTNNTSIIEQLKSEGLLDNYQVYDDSTPNFHLIDFDADGLTDVMFYGYAGGESKDIIFFRNEGNSYSKVLSVMGELVFVSNFKAYEPLSFAVNHYGCCASINDVFEYYTPTNIGGKFKFQLTNKIAHIQGMEFPNSEFIAPVTFKTVNPEYTLRLKPFIDNSEPHHADYDMPGNTIAIYPPESIGTAIATRTDETGRVWYFAIMRNNIKPIKEILFKGYNNDDPYYSIGWISSRFVKKM
ncbi:hypothetical protein [Roseivirga pacifica]|uniref:hypothetical protein n=1 Tax=Roseivirga pacifica TaxID=1267423 RepID=UPI00227A3E34|nr:hypothetical protein [Roseivirga pacifica]